MPMDLAVIRLQSTPTPDRGYKQLQTMGDDPVEVMGIQTLVQIITLLLFQKPGSDILNQEYGVDLPGLLSRPVGSAQAHKADAAILYSLLQDQVLALQRSDDTPEDERLASLALENVFMDGNKFVHQVRITSAAGSSVVINTKDLFV